MLQRTSASRTQNKWMFGRRLNRNRTSLIMVIIVRWRAAKTACLDTWARTKPPRRVDIGLLTEFYLRCGIHTTPCSCSMVGVQCNLSIAKDQCYCKWRDARRDDSCTLPAGAAKGLFVTFGKITHRPVMAAGSSRSHWLAIPPVPLEGIAKIIILTFLIYIFK